MTAAQLTVRFLTETSLCSGHAPRVGALPFVLPSTDVMSSRVLAICPALSIYVAIDCVLSSSDALFSVVPAFQLPLLMLALTCQLKLRSFLDTLALITLSSLDAGRSVASIGGLHRHPVCLRLVLLRHMSYCSFHRWSGSPLRMLVLGSPSPHDAM